jgi:UDP-N-acetylmuramoyl-tripeptide--D-alanyl-D-alanine ligase
MKLIRSFLRDALPSSTIIYFDALYDSNSVKLDDLESCDLLDEKKEYFVSIDSRTIKPGDIFCALAGEKVDGHFFAINALSNGARGLIVNQSQRESLFSADQSIFKEKIIISVPDTYKALISLATQWRLRLQCPIIGITGSLGKTTTKEMLRSIMESAGVRAYLSHKNQNTALGVALNVLSMNSKHSVGIFEAGINDKGEMDEIVDIVRPDIGLITTISHMHTQGLGLLRDVAREKLKLFKYLKPNGIGIVSGDNVLLNSASYPHPIIRFGRKMKNQVHMRKMRFIERSSHEHFSSEGSISFILKVYGKSIPVVINSESIAMVDNALAATTVAYILGVSIKKIAQGLEDFRPIAGRFKKEYSEKFDSVLINDCYNAGPDSMKNAITSFDKMKSNGKKIVVLGEMLELGEKELYWHRKIGRELCKLKKLDHLILVGERAKSIAKTAPLTMKIDFFSSWEDACECLEKSFEKKSLVLLKGSRSVGLSNIVSKLIS